MVEAQICEVNLAQQLVWTVYVAPSGLSWLNHILSLADVTMVTRAYTLLQGKNNVKAVV
jgi:hypothetical protein